MKIYYHPDYVAAAHVFATTRKPAWVYGDLMDRPLSGIEWAEPHAVTPELLALVHTPDYVEAVRTGTPLTLASTCGFPWEPGLWRATTRSTGGVVTAAIDAWKSKQNTGSLSSGLHHARRERGKAFCTFNGLALAAHTLLAAGAKRLLILDLDAHGGGGTHEIVGATPGVIHVDISTCNYDRHTAKAPSYYNWIGDAANYLPTLQRRLVEVLAAGPFDLCLYNAGVDCHENDPAGSLDGMTTDLLRRREELVFAWGQAHRIPITFVLAGGYPGEGHSQETVVALHRQTIEAALGSIKTALN
jgi:acetoin utilization deacetylase AcuC-like enzyme